MLVKPLSLRRLLNFFLSFVAPSFRVAHKAIKRPNSEIFHNFPEEPLRE